MCGCIVLCFMFRRKHIAPSIGPFILPQTTTLSFMSAKASKLPKRERSPSPPPADGDVEIPNPPKRTITHKVTLEQLPKYEAPSIELFKYAQEFSSYVIEQLKCTHNPFEGEFLVGLWKTFRNNPKAILPTIIMLIPWGGGFAAYSTNFRSNWGCEMKLVIKELGTDQSSLYLFLVKTTLTEHELGTI